MEQIRALKLKIVIDTNKQTIEKEFESLTDLIDFYNEYFNTNYRSNEQDPYEGMGEDT